MKRAAIVLFAICSSAVLFGDSRSDCLSAAQKSAQVLLDKDYSFSRKAGDVKGIVLGIVSSLEACGFNEEDLRALRALQLKIVREVEVKARNNEILPSSYYAAEIQKRLMALGLAGKANGNTGADSPEGSVRENATVGGGSLPESSLPFPVDGFVVKEKLDLSENMSLIEVREIRTDLKTLERRIVNLNTAAGSYQMAFITMIIVLTAVTAIVVVMLFIVSGQKKRIEHLALKLRALDKIGQ